MAPPPADPYKTVKDVIAGTCGAFLRKMGVVGGARQAWVIFRRLRLLGAAPGGHALLPRPVLLRDASQLLGASIGRAGRVFGDSNLSALPPTHSAPKRASSALHQPPILISPSPSSRSSSGGIAVTMVGHPFDTVKVRLQTQPSANPVYCEFQEESVREREREERAAQGPPPLPIITSSHHLPLSCPPTPPHPPTPSVPSISGRPGLRPQDPGL
jgi:hypothetical protein